MDNKWHVISLGYIVKRYIGEDENGGDIYEYETNERGETRVFDDYYEAQYTANFFNNVLNKPFPRPRENGI